MSLISGKYWTGDPKIKPAAWGPFEDVQAAISENSSKFNIPSPKAVFPLWEGSGAPRNVVSGELGILTGSTMPTWGIGRNGLELAWQANDTGFLYDTGFNGLEYASSNKWSAFSIGRPHSSQTTSIPVISPGSSLDTYRHALLMRYNNTTNFNSGFVCDYYNYAITAGQTVTQNKNVFSGGANYSTNSRVAWQCVDNKIVVATDTRESVNRQVVTKIALGTYYASAIKGGRPILNLVYFWPDYALSYNDFCTLSDNPYGLLHPITRRSYFISSGDITIKTISDSCFCSDTISGISNQFSIVDVGYGIDGFYGMSADLSVSDTGSGSENINTVASISVNDTASAIDIISNILNYCSVVDSVAGADSIANILVSVAVADNGAVSDVVDVLKELLKTVTDSCLGVDSISQILADISVADNGSGADFLSLITDILKTISDGGTGVDSVSIQPVSVSVQDAGTALDMIGHIAVALSVSDAGTIAEIISTIKTKMVTVTDTGTGYDSEPTISVSVTVSDTAAALDVLGQVINALAVYDTGSGLDRITKTDFNILPSGKVTVTFTIKTPGASFAMRTPKATFNIE